MARLVQAVAMYRPRVIRNSTLGVDHVAEYMARGTGISDSQITMLLTELHKAIVFLNSAGFGVKLPDIGTFGPAIDRHGRLSVSYFTDPKLRRGLNEMGTGGLTIRNRKNIGLDDAGFKALWDADHPDDPVVLTEF
jgi:hypothetical protein